MLAPALTGGGGKTLAILAVLIDHAARFPKSEISVVSESVPHLRRGAIKDFAKQEMERIEEQEAALLLSQIVAIIKKDGRKKGGKRMELESYSDYPQAVRNNAKRGIVLNEKNGNKCATPVGKVRASVLGARQPSCHTIL